MLAASCTDDGGETVGQGPVELDSVETVAALATFDSCDALLDQLKAEATERVGPYGLQDQGVFPFDAPLAAEGGARSSDDAAAEFDVQASPVAPAAGGDGDGGVSGTNVQEAGVDEPDLVKATEERMVVASNGNLVVIDLTGDEPTEVGRLTLPSGFDHELLLDGDTALVLTRSDGETFTDDVFIGDSSYPGGFQQETTLFRVDLSDPTTPALNGTLSIESGYVSARLVDGRARVVVSRPAPTLGFVYPSQPGNAGEKRATQTNEQVIAESTLDDWLPGWTLDVDGTTRSGRLDDCAQVHVPGEFAGFGIVSVLDIEIGSALSEPAPVSVVGGGDTVYASTDNLYVATQRTADPVEDEPEESASPTTRSSQIGGDAIVAPPEPADVVTSIHRFATPADGPLVYEASGEVEGRLLNQFALSEHEDVLRVASTRGQAWFDGDSDSLVTTLALEGDRLVEQGRVTDLGRGEEIFSVRFIGEVGYVVTFRQTDPLYVIDLRDPSTPTVSGELKILGYSAYLHPLDETHLLGIGQNADESGRTSGTQISLFDVSDPANPTRTARYEVPGGSSEVEWDHRAFTWWAPTGTAVIPVDQYDQGDYRTGALAVTVDIDGSTIVEQGRADHENPVRRSVVIDDVVATIDSGVVVFSTLGDLTRESVLSL